MRPTYDRGRGFISENLKPRSRTLSRARTRRGLRGAGSTRVAACVWASHRRLLVVIERDRKKRLVRRIFRRERLGRIRPDDGVVGGGVERGDTRRPPDPHVGDWNL